MKKILFCLTLIMGLVFIANAQNVERGKFFNNVYVGVDGGIISALSQPEGSTYFGFALPTFGIELGKNITPVVGLSLVEQGQFNFTDKNVVRTNTIANLKINLSNWFGGYKGYPRTVEFVLVPGIGWMHDFQNTRDPNYITYNTGCEVNFNFGEARAWQIGLRPSVVWNNRDGSGMGFYMSKADLRLACGVTYKFGYKNSKGKTVHNFTLVDKGVSEKDYQNLQARYDELLNSTPDSVVVERTVVVEKIVNEAVPMDLVIYFDKGSSAISTLKEAQIVAFANAVKEGTTVKVIGSADTGTGSYDVNSELADQRANAVADILYRNGVKHIEIGVSLDVDSDPSSSRCAIIEVMK